MSAPIIGITLDSEESGGYSDYPWYGLRQNYCDSVAMLGAVPIALPHYPERAAEYLRLIDGVIVTGGAFDVSPSLYGEPFRHSTVTLKSRRTEFEWAITKLALEAKKPILGICGGEQLLNVILGGTLIQHIPDEVPNALEHEQKTPKTEGSHDVKVTEGSLLHRITGMSRFMVNSTHHQAVAKPAQGVVVNALAPDGVIEGIEYPSHPFCLGVQWHPEFEVSAADKKIFEAFVKSCR